MELGHAHGREQRRMVAVRGAAAAAAAALVNRDSEFRQKLRECVLRGVLSVPSLM